MKHHLIWLIAAVLGATVTTGVARGNPLDEPPPCTFLAGNDTLSEYDGTGALIRTFAGATGVFDVTVNPLTGNVFASDPLNNVLYAIDYMAGTVYTVSDLVFDQPSDLKFNDNGLLYVTNRGTNAVLEMWVDLPGFDLDVAAVSSSVIGAGYLDDPNGIAFDENGNMFITSGTSDIVVLDSSFEYVDTYSLPGSLIDPGGIDYADGYLYVVSQGTDGVLRVNALTGALEGSATAPFAGPTSLEIAECADALLIADDSGVLLLDLETGVYIDTFSVGPKTGVAQAIPEPATLALVGIGLGALIHRRRKKA